MLLLLGLWSLVSTRASLWSLTCMNDSVSEHTQAQLLSRSHASNDAVQFDGQVLHERFGEWAHELSCCRAHMHIMMQCSLTAICCMKHSVCVGPARTVYIYSMYTAGLFSSFFGSKGSKALEPSNCSKGLTCNFGKRALGLLPPPSNLPNLYVSRSL